MSSRHVAPVDLVAAWGPHSVSCDLPKTLLPLEWGGSIVVH